MGKLYRDKDEIAIPAEAYVNTYDGRVYVKQADERGRERRVVIGKAATATTMAPNESFRALFPALWEAAYGRDETVRLEVSVGTYALVLGAGLKSGAYPIAQSVYGLDAGNALMDYAAFSLLERSDSTHLIEERLADAVTFCPTVRSDGWYSDLFATLTDSQHIRFKAAWLRRCVEMGVDEVWVCVDGSNNDCCATGSDLPEHGENKSHDHSKTMVSHVEAVDSRDGRPITYFASEGGMVDSKAFQEVILFLTLWGMRVRGVILDRGFCTPAVVRTLRELGIDFVIMLPHDTGGYKSALSELGEEIRWDTAHLVSETGVFGVSSVRRVWARHEDEAHVNLYFSGTSGSIQSVALIRRVTEAMAKARAALALGRRPKVEKGMQKYVRLVEGEDGRVTSVEYDHDAWDAALAEKGFFAMISSSDEMGTREVWDAYQLRDASEKQYSILESQEGFDATRTHTTPSIRSKFAVGFLASILRHEVRVACEALGLDCNRMLRKVGRIHLLRSAAGIYTPVRKYTGDQTRLLSAVGVETEDFVGIAQDFNQRLLNPIHSQKHRLPEHAPVHRKGRGRPKGSKNRKTVEREREVERQRAAGTYVEPVKRRPGRPKGSKDTKPRKRRSDAGVKRGPRRPKPSAAETTSPKAQS